MISAVDRAIAVSIVIVFTIVFAIGDYLSDMNEVAHHMWADLGWTLASFAAAIRCFITARLIEDDDEKKAWMLFGMACFSWFLGMLVWSYLELIKGIVIPFPGLSDIGFLLFAPLILAGLIVHLRSAESLALSVKSLSEFALIICVILITLIVSLYEPIVSSDNSTLYVLTALAYPALYVGVLIFSFFRWFSVKAHTNMYAYLFLISALLIHSITNTVYAYSLLGRSYDVGDFLDMFWVIGFGLIYLAAHEGRMNKSNQEILTNELVVARAKYLESIIPGVAIAWLAALFIVFIDSITSEITALILPLVFMAAIFIAVIGWANFHLQQKIHSSLVMAEDKLKYLNADLEDRIKRRTLELEASIQKAERASNAKSEFLSHMSHELRTPMNAIIGFSQILEMDESLSDEQRECVSYINESGGHLLSLINDTLDLQGIENDRITIDFENLDLFSVVGECFSVLKHLSIRKNVFLCSNIQRNEVCVRADRLKLRQVLINIISNAIKYNHADGSVTISHENRDNNIVRILVSDTGLGIPAAKKDLIFDPFVRLNPGVGEGSGVGLAVSRRLAIAMNGRIDFESTVNHGTTFWVDLYAGITEPD